MFLLCYIPESRKLLLDTRNDSGLLAIEIIRQGRMFLLCYIPESRKLLLDTRNDSGLLAIESSTIAYREKRSWKLSIPLANDTTHIPYPPHKSLQVGRNLLDGLVSHSARS